MSYRKMDYIDMKNNFDYIMNLPAVRALIMKNEKLMKKNKQLRQMNRILTETIYKHSVKPAVKSAKRNPLRNSNPASSPSTEQPTSLGPNIKYEIVSDDKEWNEEIDDLNEKMGEIAIKNIATETEKTTEKEEANDEVEEEAEEEEDAEEEAEEEEEEEAEEE